jgi:hypothetical protein
MAAEELRPFTAAAAAVRLARIVTVQMWSSPYQCLGSSSIWLQLLLLLLGMLQQQQQLLGRLAAGALLSRAVLLLVMSWQLMWKPSRR